MHSRLFGGARSITQRVPWSRRNFVEWAAEAMRGHLLLARLHGHTEGADLLLLVGSSSFCLHYLAVAIT
jgi:hypothetical protein